MASYVVITIDTTSPNIEIYAPSYTTVDLVNEITIQADENLSLNGVEIYSIDSNGNRVDYTFDLEGDKFVGYVKFTNAPIGSIVTVYAKVSDEVGNMSNLVSKTIHIANSITLLTVEISDRVASVDISDNVARTDITDMDRSEKIGNNNN